MVAAAAADAYAAGTCPTTPSVLLVGNYCHDVLFRPNALLPAHTLGGAASFVSAVLDPLLLAAAASLCISKVGPDFAYSHLTRLHPPIISSNSSPTTVFHAHFPTHSDRILVRVRSCEPIHPHDLPSPSPHYRIRFGLAAAVAGEICPLTLARMVQLCEFTFVDVQALIRRFDPVNGHVGLCPLSTTEFAGLIPEIDFLKASSDEAAFVDVEQMRHHCCVIVTEGKDGCSIFWKDGEVKITPFPSTQVDPTGAGDSFLGGLIAGLFWGLSVPDAALLGNFFGAATVAQVGVPKFNSRMLEAVKSLLENMAWSFKACSSKFSFEKSEMHDKFYESLRKVGGTFACCNGSPNPNASSGNCCL